MAQQNKIYGALGLAKKSGRLVSGEFMTEKSVKEGKAFLVIVALDASDNTKKNFNDMCSYYHVPIIEYGLKDELGKAIGTEFRASIALNDLGFSKSILKSFKSLSDMEVVIDE